MALSLLKFVRNKKRRGRGIGSRGAKSGRGMKGQKSRAGYSRKAGFEGGQTPLYMRLPKLRGSKQKFSSQVVKPEVVTTQQLNRFADGVRVDSLMLFEAGLIRNRRGVIKVIGNHKVTRRLTVRVHRVTPGAKQAIEAAGGTLETINV